MPSPPEDLAAQAVIAISALPTGRQLVALAGPPGAGKSTVADLIATQMQAQGRSAAVVPMDGFHLDNRLLTKRGLQHRKGAPETFDVDGFTHLVRRIASGDQTVIYPAFDRSRDIAIAGAVALAPETEIILFEGNYLLLDDPAWAPLHRLWSLTLAVTAPRDVLQDRLMARWRTEGLDEATCHTKVADNDMPNVDLVLTRSVAAQITLTA